MKRAILLMIAVVVCGCANHREARRKSVQLSAGSAADGREPFWNAK